MSANAEEKAQPRAVRRGLSREITLGRSKQDPPKPPKPRAAASDGLVIGAEPSVSLLPPEVQAVVKARSTRNVVFFAVVGVVAVMGLATAAASVLATDAQTRATLKQQDVQNVILQQQHYAPVLKVKQNVALAQAAQRVATRQEIDWKDYFGRIDAVMPKAVAITSIAGAVGQGAASAPSSPLLGTGVATVTLQITAPDSDAIAATLDALTGVTGYVSATPGAIAKAGDSWATTIVLQVGSDAFDHRFADNGK